MGAEEVDWDLNAVVRSFYTGGAATRTPTAVNCEDPLPCLAFGDVGDGSTQSQTSSGDPFGFEELLKPRSDGFDELHQLYRPNLASSSKNSNKSPTEFQKQICSMNVMIPPPPPPSTVVFPGGFRKPILPVQSPIPRSRKRKNQVKKAVCHVTAENLSSDLWAWRKYGQKPIKGSPFPRNYYRCSSSKGCGARKQVERSTTDHNMFIVTYTGDHTHPRPTHRNSLAGSTRNKFTNTLHKPTTGGGAVSPTTPLTAEEPVLSMDDKAISDDMDEDNFVDGDDLLISNLLGSNLSDDFFMFGLQPDVNNNVSNSSSDNFSSGRS